MLNVMCEMNAVDSKLERINGDGTRTIFETKVSVEPVVAPAEGQKTPESQQTSGGRVMPGRIAIDAGKFVARGQL